jgi:hypothetical protein
MPLQSESSECWREQRPRQGCRLQISVSESSPLKLLLFRKKLFDDNGTTINGKKQWHSASAEYYFDALRALKQQKGKRQSNDTNNNNNSNSLTSRLRPKAGSFWFDGAHRKHRRWHCTLSTHPTR